MKTITMYELLGMVKDGKELPKKVEVLDVIYEFDDHRGDYYNKSLDRYLFVSMTTDEEWKLAFFLNNEVEILEEKKIPEKLGLINYSEDQATSLIHHKVDEIIDYLQYLESKGE